ncbi:hypothetical protein ACNFU2_08335 [Chryseobacterium sp. PTM-20240506]|uniref:hypothetical protein n=1 Tax=unclassified Chryseobacterium TaxID=2593645 RepID=UPI002359EA98|nr:MULTISPECIES: hypothetical protein [unclassified Chryseobacterium]MDC8104825.1 hypothetical protein [Chryseobacterium sp. B21-037]MDQ1805157.1 hypothetical protein [Chryseobacterium sp. CKR4-1]
MRKYFIIVFLILSNLILVYSQVSQITNFFPQSPNSTAFAINGKIPVNMYKGTPSLSIPLFSNSIGGKPFEISLNYNVKSVKPEIIPTWTGLGWNLEVGGTISRIVNGGVDEVYQNNIPPYNKFSYLDNYSTLDNPSWASQQALQTYSQNNLQYIASNEWGVVPGPDEFILNFCGITGSFYLNEKGQWIGRTRDGRTFKITYGYKYDFKLNEKAILGGDYIAPKTTTIKRILYGFTIIFDDGTEAVFGNDDNALEFTSTDENIDTFNPQVFVSNWYLKEIKFTDNKKILFSYVRDERAVFLNNKGGYVFYNKKDAGPWTNNSSSGGNLNQIGTNRLHNTYLDKIEGEDFIIRFNKSLSNQKEYGDFDYAIGTWGGFYTHHMSSYRNFKHWYKLDNISIEDKMGHVVKSILFNYNNIPSDRLLLNELIINGIEKYKFLYNAQKLPDYLSTSTDEWGYYNGNTLLSSNTSNLSPEQLRDFLKNNYPQSKAPSLSFSRASTLEQVIYPTGGSTYFTYELNTYSKYGEKEITQSPLKISSTANDEFAGGLRIQKIKSCNENNNCFQKNYSYLNDDGRSSGILPYKPLYIIEGSEVSPNLSFWEWSSHSYQRLKDEDNSIGYSKVTEIDDNGGKKETYFTNFDNSDFNDTAGIAYFGWNNIGMYKQLPYTSFSLMRGKPSREILYSSTKKISETTYSYLKHIDYIKSYTFSYKQFGQQFSNPPFVLLDGITYGSLLDAHYVNFNTSFLNQKKTIFENVETTEQNFYNYIYNVPTLTWTTQSDGNVYKTNYKYAFDISNQAMMNAYMVGIPISIDNKLNDKTISKIEVLYPLSLPTVATGSLILPLSSLSYDIQNNTPSTEVTYNKYDSKGNIQQYTTKDGIPTSVVWGYNNTQPIAKVQGATYAQLVSLGLITAIVDASDQDAANPANEPALITALDNFRKNSGLSAYQISTYTYDPLIGVTSITPPSGIREVYIYDTANRLKEIRQDSKTGNLIKEFKYNYKN